MSPEQLLAEAQQKGILQIALTDINNTSGILDFFRLAKNYDVKPAAGIDFRNGTEQKFIGIAKTHEGFYELNKFLSEHLESKDKFSERAPEFENAFVIYPFSPIYRKLRENEFIGIKISDLTRLQFSDWKNHPEKLVLLAPVTFRNKIDFSTHRLLRAIDKNTLLSKLDEHEQAQPDEVVLTQNEMEIRLRDYSFLIQNTKNILEKCSIDFEFGQNKNKKHFTENEGDDRKKLELLCEEGLKYRYTNPDEKRQRVEKELKMIYEKDFASYFLINHDIFQYAK
jgi:DNA polymerase-3 subunit alpha